MDGLATQFHQQHLRFAMQSDHGPAAFVMDNFQIVPIELLPDARAERLTDGFLASEARRDTGGRIGLLLAIRDLVRSKKFVQKFYYWLFNGKRKLYIFKIFLQERLKAK